MAGMSTVKVLIFFKLLHSEIVKENLTKLFIITMNNFVIGFSL